MISSFDGREVLQYVAPIINGAVSLRTKQVSSELRAFRYLFMQFLGETIQRICPYEYAPTLGLSTQRLLCVVTTRVEDHGDQMPHCREESLSQKRKQFSSSSVDFIKFVGDMANWEIILA